MPSRKLLCILVLPCIIGALFYAAALHYNINYAHQPVVNANLHIFGNLSELASEFPHFDELISNLIDVRISVRDTGPLLNHTDIPEDCKQDVALLVDITVETIDIIEDSLVQLAVSASYAVYQFVEINNQLLNNPSAAYVPAMYQLLAILGGLAQHTRPLPTRYELLSSLLAHSSNICKDIHTKQPGYAGLWHRLFDGHIDSKLLELDIALFTDFAAMQHGRQEELERMRKTVETNLHIVQRLYELAKHSLINIVPEADYVSDIESTNAKLREIYTYLVRM